MKQKTKFKQTEIGLIPEDWEVKELKEVASYITEKINLDEININNFISTENMLSDKRGVTVASSLPKVGKVTEFKEGDILFSNIRTYFKKLWLAKFSGGCSNDVLIIRKKSDIDNEYLYYYLSQDTFFAFTVLTSKGTKMPRGDKNAIMSYEINIPPLPEQRAIAKILSDLDSKIELLQKQNKTLEKIGQTIFKHWFVDFEFPNEGGKPYKSSGGEMVYNEELGKEIPKGWSISNLGEFIDLQKGLSYKGKYLVKKEEGMPLVNLGTFEPSGGFKEDGIKYYAGEYKERHVLKPEDLIVANTDITQKREVLGRPAIIPRSLGSKVLFTHHIFAIRHKKNILNNKLNNKFLYFMLQTRDYRKRSMGFATGTTVLALPREAILDLSFVLPSQEIIEEFNNFAYYLFEKMEINHEQIQTLQKIRDLLLPKLMTGKIRVPVEVRE